MRVKWDEYVDIPEIYWEDNIDIDLATIHKEGEVISTMGSFWGPYFIIKLEDGSFIKKSITEVIAVE